MNIKAEIHTEIHGTEDEQKIRAALENLFPGMAFERDGAFLKGQAASQADFEKLREMIFSKRIIEAVRSVFMSSASGAKTLMKLHKQAAAAGRVAVVEDDSESPLGPIIVQFESDELQKFIDWFSPHTVNGVPVV